jgi:hypothetical protein
MASTTSASFCKGDRRAHRLHSNGQEGVLPTVAAQGDPLCGRAWVVAVVRVITYYNTAFGPADRTHRPKIEPTAASRLSTPTV